MARVTRVQRAAKPHTCGKGHPIEKGEPYLWAKPGFRGRKMYRCLKHPFRESDLATGLNQAPLAAREEFDDALDGLEAHDYDGLSEAVETFRSALEDYVAEREQGLDAWENGNSTLEELRDQAQECLDSFDFEPEEFDQEEPSSETADPEPQAEDFEQEEDYVAARDEWEQNQADAEQEWSDWDAERDQHWEDQVEAAREAAQGLDL